MPAVVAAVQITSPSHHDADQMKETFYSLAAAKDKNGGKVDDATSLEVQRILDLVTENLVGALWQDREAAQLAYNNSVAQLNGCNSEFLATPLNSYRQAQALTGNVLNDWLYCAGQTDSMCIDEKEACDAADKYVCDFEICADDALRSDGCTDCKDQNPRETDLYATLNCLVKQKDAEEEVCREQNQIAGYCRLHDGCWNTRTVSLSQLGTTTRTLESIFQSQYVALQCLLCYGEQILANTTDLSVCENATPPTFGCAENEIRSETSPVSLAICYYDPEPQYDCEGEKDLRLPCTPGYASRAQYPSMNGTCAYPTGPVCFNECTISP